MVEIPARVGAFPVRFYAELTEQQKDDWSGYTYSPPEGKTLGEVWPDPRPIFSVDAGRRRRILQRLSLRGVGKFVPTERVAALIVVERGNGTFLSYPLTASGNVIEDAELEHPSIDDVFEEFGDVEWRSARR